MATLDRRLPPRPLPAQAAPTGYAAPGDRAARGKSCRSTAPRSSHAAWEPPPDRRDPIALLEEQAAERVPELVPIRYGRMAASPFAFYRGAPYGMAADLAGTPRTGIRVQLCGDAHLANFGGFASAGAAVAVRPQRLRRNAARTVGMGREATGGERSCRGSRQRLQAQTAGGDDPENGRRVPHAIRHFATMKTLDVWYAWANVSELQELLRSQGSRSQVKRLDKAVEKGRRKDSARASRSSPFSTTARRASGPTLR